MCEQTIMLNIHKVLIVMMDNKNEFQFDYLSPTNFNNLIFLIHFLKLFKDWTIQTEKTKKFLNIVFLAYDAFFNYLEKT